MSGAGSVGAADPRGVMALRAAILERNAALGGAAAPDAGPSFAAAITDAMAAVNKSQAAAGHASSAYERGDSVDIAGVMLARQQAALAFEATLQVRNKLLGAYKDIMSMPV